MRCEKKKKKKKKKHLICDPFIQRVTPIQTQTFLCFVLQPDLIWTCEMKWPREGERQNRSRGGDNPARHEGMPSGAPQWYRMCNVLKLMVRCPTVHRWSCGWLIWPCICYQTDSLSRRLESGQCSMHTAACNSWHLKFGGAMKHMAACVRAFQRLATTQIYTQRFSVFALLTFRVIKRWTKLDEHAPRNINLLFSLQLWPWEKNLGQTCNESMGQHPTRYSCQKI